MTRALLSILASLLCLSGCARVGVIVVDGEIRRTAIPKVRESTFDPAEYEAYAGEGGGTIEGEVTVKHRGRRPAHATDDEVILTPVTGYSREWFDRTILDGQPLQTMDSRAAAFSRFTRTDLVGRFHFEGLPPGEYFLVCEVRLTEPAHVGSIGGRTRESDYSTLKAHARVTVIEGRTTTAVVTR